MSPFLDALAHAAEEASAAEASFRRDAAERTKALERERAFAFRRLNLMRAVADAMATAETEEAAVAAARATLRGRLGWASDSEARDAVAERFTPVATAMFASLAPDAEQPPDIGAALDAFESWYASTHPGPFWALFEQYIPETPVVDF